jgi:hypothetical protein
LLGIIRRVSHSEEKLIQNFKEGFELGRLYYEGFADFFYEESGAETMKKHLKKLLEDDYIKKLDDKLILTRKG